jgi:hypothetical protein
MIAANLGVNPSLTICALTERAMSFIPPASQTDWNDGPEGNLQGEKLMGTAAGS